jgi:hypothetical protein
MPRSASSLPDAADAPYARRKTPPSSKTGSDESKRGHWNWNCKGARTNFAGFDDDHIASWDGSVWESQPEKLVMDMMQNICDVLARLDRREVEKSLCSVASTLSV